MTSLVSIEGADPRPCRPSLDLYRSLVDFPGELEDPHYLLLCPAKEETFFPDEASLGLVGNALQHQSTYHRQPALPHDGYFMRREL